MRTEAYETGSTNDVNERTDRIRTLIRSGFFVRVSILCMLTLIIMLAYFIPWSGRDHPDGRDYPEFETEEWKKLYVVPDATMIKLYAARDIEHHALQQQIWHFECAMDQEWRWENAGNLVKDDLLDFFSEDSFDTMHGEKQKVGDFEYVVLSYLIKGALAHSGNGPARRHYVIFFGRPAPKWTEWTDKLQAKDFFVVPHQTSEMILAHDVAKALLPNFQAYFSGHSYKEAGKVLEDRFIA